MLVLQNNCTIFSRKCPTENVTKGKQRNPLRARPPTSIANLPLSRQRQTNLDFRIKHFLLNFQFKKKQEGVLNLLELNEKTVIAD